MMNILDEVDLVDDFGMLSPRNIETPDNRSAISSSRGSKKRNLFIVSNQNTKMFPSDFFQNVKEQSGYKSEKNLNPNSFLSSNFNTNAKHVLDFDKDLEEDRELLEMLSDKSFKTNDCNIDKVNTYTSLPNLSSDVPKNNKIMYDLKTTGFEMIPEEDEERIKTEYESSKKFFDHKARNKENSFNLNSVISRNSIISNRGSDNRLREIEAEEKVRDILSPNKKYETASVIKIKHIRQLSREKSIESLSTHEYTNDSTKNKRILNQYNYNTEKDNSRQSIFDFSKLNAVNSTSKTLHGDLNNIDYEISAFTPKQLQPIRRRQKSEYDSANFNLPENTNGDNIIIKKNSNLFSQKRSMSNRGTKAGSANNNAIISTKNNVKNNKSISERSAKTNLPNIVRKGSEMKNVNEIRNIFAEADNFKEDPVIKKKLDNIMQNILDIRNVLSQKSNSRMKIASAPIQNEEITPEYLLDNFDTGNYVDPHDDEDDFLRALNPTRSKHTSNKNVVMSLKTKKIILANNIGETKINNFSNSHSSNNISSNSTNKTYNPYNPSILSKREKMPIKLIKKEKEREMTK